MQKHHGLLHVPDTADEASLPAWYRASDVDTVLQAVRALLQVNENISARLKKAGGWTPEERDQHSQEID